jgi:hypothetical protein
MALTQARQLSIVNFPRIWRTFGVADSAKLYAGGMVGRNASGYLVRAHEAEVVLGFATDTADNTDGADGDLELEVDSGIANYENSAGGEAVAIEDIGADCYAVDDETVAKTAGGTAQVTDATLTFNGTDTTGLTIAGKLVTVVCDTDADTTVTALYDALVAHELAEDFTFTDMTTKVRIAKKTGGSFSIVPYKPATATFVIAEVTPGEAPDRPRAGKVHKIEGDQVYVDFR